MTSTTASKGYQIVIQNIELRKNQIHYFRPTKSHKHKNNSLQEIIEPTVSHVPECCNHK